MGSKNGVQQLPSLRAATTTNKNEKSPLSVSSAILAQAMFCSSLGSIRGIVSVIGSCFGLVKVRCESIISAIWNIVMTVIDLNAAVKQIGYLSRALGKYDVEDVIFHLKSAQWLLTKSEEFVKFKASVHNPVQLSLSS